MEDDDFVSIGNILSQYEEDESSKKPFHMQQQKVVDSKGRQRFHGAFTGGFSAGYFNTVGSKEGWTPSTFTSSRDKTDDTDSQQQRPEDFMDDEDLSEHGIAPRQLAISKDFQQRSERKRKEPSTVARHSIIPGDAALQDLVIPSSADMGVQLLRQLGWKDGQGIGPRVRKNERQNRATDKKVYGCSLPQEDARSDDSDDDEFAPANVTFAPKDVTPIKFCGKADMHGLGYSGIRASAVSGNSGHINLFEPPAPAVSSTGRRGMTGAAFGVGALEDDDDDIYGSESMSNYDRVLTDNQDKNFGWTAPKHKGMSSAPVGYIGKVLEGFKLSKETLNPKQVFPPPRLPRDYKPMRQRTTTQQEASAPKVQITINPKRKLDANVRKAMLGELGSVFDLISDRDKSRIESIKQEQEPQCSISSQQLASTTSHIQPSPSHSAVLPVTSPQLPVEKQREQNVPLNRGAVGFKPFASDAEKQKRYENFLDMKNKGIKYEARVPGMTEWELAKESEDFARAASLYRPLSVTMASRFTSAKYADSEKDVTLPDMLEKDERKKAVEMKMFGRLTRQRYEWHPDRVLCKRFNVANPYPESLVPGVPGGTRRETFAGTDFLNQSSAAAVVESATEVDNSIERVPEVAPEVKPLAILSMDDNNLQSVNTPRTPLTTGADETRMDVDMDSVTDTVKQEEKERPSMDIFKAIFADSDSDASSEDDDDEPAAETGALTFIDVANAVSVSSAGPSSTATSAQNTATSLSQPADSTSQNGTIKIASIEERLHDSTDSTRAPNTEEGTGQGVAEQPSYGPALPPALPAGSQSQQKHKRKKRIKSSKAKHKDKKKKSKSKHKKHKSKERKRRKERKRQVVVVSSSSGSSSSGSDADVDSDPDTVTDQRMLNRLQQHPTLQRMSAADFM